MTQKLNIYKGLTLGNGGNSLAIEKVNAENIYIRINSTSLLRIIPTRLIVDLLKHLKSNLISVRDINRKYRADEGLPHLFDFLDFDYDKYLLGYDATISKICEFELENKSDVFDQLSSIKVIDLPKPFILLSGISGTGKTRFVKQQAYKFKKDGSNYQLVPVRPDWHEPSDLLGYISRLGNQGAQYIATDFLVFLVSAWKEAVDCIIDDEVILNQDAVPFWLCLDEMNLAPVEQYLADYLSVIETREWDAGAYSCESLLNASIFGQLADSDELRKDLKLKGEKFDDLWGYFLTKGISIAPNLIVAGTVNMDETTHGFSRKVIDRAYTLDFGEFYPNDYQYYFEAKTQAKTLTYPMLSCVKESELVGIDDGGMKSIAFLELINAVLKLTAFELAFRALNELLIAVVCFEPKTDTELQSVWDDFLMTKVLPRIDGDNEKLLDDGDTNLLKQLNKVLENQLSVIWSDQRPDLLREGVDGGVLPIECRSKKKLVWMQSRLDNNGFTSFWP